ncbi:MAG: class I SAM-dependent methyltransferase [Gammaproteobacteria bacterium]|jgi:SAM-dependent methyltransferase|nr:class I SAM-dependent methyltransferase [Gammaproteobacteria bacterium]
MSDAAGFDADWLTLREPADRAARAQALVERLARWLATRPGGRCVDLGSGHGSNLRYLADRLPAATDWLLIDHDSDLLSRARDRVAGTHPALAVELRTLDLERLERDDLDGAGLVTASALFDLASREWIDRLARQCRDAGAAVLFSLTVDGRRSFEDADGKPLADPDEADDDRWMAERFNRHQRRTKGLGSALGPDAAEALPLALAAAGFEVYRRASDWELRAGRSLTQALGRALLVGWRDAVLDITPSASARIERWSERRSRALAGGTIGLRVGHVDVLGLPPG